MPGTPPIESGQEITPTNTPTDQPPLPNPNPLRNWILANLSSFFGRGRTGTTHLDGTLREIASSVSETAQERDKRVLGWDEPPSRQDVVGYLQDHAMSLRNFSQFEEQWEVVTSELVNGLIDYFEKRAKELGRSKQNPLVIAEVGAGVGRLAYFVNKALRERELDEAIKYSASDGRPEPGKPKTRSDLRPEIKGFRYGTDYSDGLKVDGNPADVVLAVWPAPMIDGIPGRDWTQNFRSKGVGEYILIGNPPVCGDLVDTWGIIGRDTTGKVPAYETDGIGYKKVDLDPVLSQIPLLGGSDNPNESPQETNSEIAVFRKVA